MAWLLLYVEDQLARLPLLLLGPTVGAVIGTAVAVSELATVRIDGRLAAAPPGVWEVLWPALLGGIGGIFFLASLAALWGWGWYFWRGGDAKWRAIVHGGMVQLVCRNEEVPADPDQLGAMDCFIERPSGEFDWTDQFTARPGRPRGVIAPALSSMNEPGVYRIRWYATEHRRLLHEVARMDWRVEPEAG